MKKRVSLKIWGSVQGVFFRHETREKARGLGLSGYAQNEPDGTVFIVAEGAKPRLKEFIKWCEKGPQLANVVKTKALWQEPTGEFQDFTINH